MTLSLKPSEKPSEPWLAHRSGVDINTICTRILTADICLSDLDDTDADSPAKKIAFQGIGRQFNPLGYFYWCAETAVQYARHGKKAESEQWKKYATKFLRFPDSKEKVRSWFTPNVVTASLYPGVQELYALVPAQKWYITRNIAEIANAYGSVLGFQGFIPEAFDKERSTELFVNEHPQFRSYFIKGDSSEDEQMLDVLAFYRSRGKVDSIVSCYRTEDSAHINHRFDINVGKNYRKLIEVLKSRSSP